MVHGARMSRPPARQRVHRGSAEDRDGQRRRIIGAAFAIQRREGREALSMRALAAEVGVSAMALYRYFPSKGDLLRAMWEVALTDAQAEVSAAMARCTTARQRLRASIDSFLRFWEARPAQFGLVYMTPETMEPGAQVDQLTREPAYQRAVDLAGPLVDELADEIGGERRNAPLARDLRMALMVGYLHARIVNTRYAWGDFDALRTATIETIAAGVESCLRPA
jgi:AcrR family transcriptional regulator